MREGLAEDELALFDILTVIEKMVGLLGLEPRALVADTRFKPRTYSMIRLVFPVLTG